jgi:hypothetical protein
MRQHAVLILAISLLTAGPQAPAWADARPVAVFDFELIDTSLEGELKGKRDDEQARLARAGEQLRDGLAASGLFRVVDIAPVAAAARGSNLQACGGCDVKLAKQVGAELAVTGTVQKVSNLILNFTVYVRDANTGNPVAVMNADFRGNTDESWTRALGWLIRNRVLAPGYGVVP